MTCFTSKHIDSRNFEEINILWKFDDKFVMSTTPKRQRKVCSILTISALLTKLWKFYKLVIFVRDQIFWFCPHPFNITNICIIVQSKPTRFWDPKHNVVEVASLDLWRLNTNRESFFPPSKIIPVFMFRGRTNRVFSKYVLVKIRNPSQTNDF